MVRGTLSAARTRALLALVVLLLAAASSRAQFLTAAPPQSEIDEIATDAYVYAYPLVLMELTRRVATNAGAGAPARTLAAPMNQFAHDRRFPDPSSPDVVRPNADVLASSLWFDVRAEPLVVDVPDSGGRYYFMSLLDLWSEVFASPGKRTSGTGRQTYAITAPGWTGTLPAGVERIGAPTSVGWLLLRVQANATDLEAVHGFQDGLRAVPLSAWGTDYKPPAATFDSSADMRQPFLQLTRLSAAGYFALFAQLLETAPPHPEDQPMLQRLARIGIVPGRPFDASQATTEVRLAVQGAPQAAAGRLFEGVKRAGIRVNGWRMVLNPIGTYGTDYLRRMVLAYGGLGTGMLVEDAIALPSVADGEGRPLESAKRYTIHFPAEQLPPARAFWSLTLYDEQQRFTPNALRRWTLGDREPLRRNPDGSLDLYVQRTTPGADKESNWLPAPLNGRFSLVLRVYWPQAAALDGTWTPPPIVPAK